LTYSAEATASAAPSLRSRFELPAFRQWRRDCALLPFECLDTVPRQEPERYIGFAERILASGWRCGPHLVESLESPIRWHGGPRSLSFHLHSWDPHAVLLMAYSLTGRSRFFAPCLAVALDWLDRGSRARSKAEAVCEQEGFAWYDMAVGLRAYRLGYLLDVAARLPDLSEDIVGRLLDSFVLHMTVLSDEGFLIGHTNHGFYQALGQLAATWRYRDDPLIAEIYAQAVARTRTMLQRQYFPEGTHREHSPGYHLATLATIKNAVSSGIVEDPGSSALIREIERAFAWFILPNGNIAAIGDTDPWVLDPAERPARRFEDPGLRWALSAGAEGEPLGENMRIFPEAGWAVVRARAGANAPIAADGYLLQWAGFHSRTHKHADHLSFIWYDAGEELVVDAGRYLYSHRTEPGSEAYANGFWYGDPYRMYVESTRAHNCVEIDGRDYQRRGAKPFGSALRRSGESAGLFWTECELYHFRSVRHARLLAFRRAHFVLVFDWLSCRCDATHRFDQWFHLAPAFEIEPPQADLGLRARNPNTGVRLCIVPTLTGGAMLPPEKGVEDPRIQGWFSDRAGNLVPNWAAAIRSEGRGATFATLLVLSERVEIDAGTARVNGSGRKGQVAWRDERGLHRLSFERPLLGSPRFDLTTAPG